MLRLDPVTSAVIEGYIGSGVTPGATDFARAVVGAAGPVGAARARSLLWATSRLAAWGMGDGSGPAVTAA
jgi:hypothetical protein